MSDENMLRNRVSHFRVRVEMTRFLICLTSLFMKRRVIHFEYVHLFFKLIFTSIVSECTQALTNVYMRK